MIEGEIVKIFIELFEKDLNCLDKLDDCIKIKVDKKSM